ncbi:hypothetical protein ZIOFF_022932 [Zingiber officinale]|uniref:Uncharacterized protein n=1 Tax=Zingiber officinale TaxID=94328 RepID=A0A8J5LKJ2_ZINOF|nr:hypothetical protein ZIOFF_022932 [Zingiber officinale]
MNSQDWTLVHKIKGLITQLPDLDLPPDDCFIIIESDGCMEGWGDLQMEIPKELIVRANCQAIISFFNKSAHNKPSRVRWISFTDFITGLGVPVYFQHIDGKDNLLADSLSRLVCFLTASSWQLEEKGISLLAQIEAAIIQVKSRPSPVAVQHVENIISTMMSTPQLLVTSPQASFSKKNTTKEKGSLKLNIKPVENYWTHIENLSTSSSSRNIFSEETNKAVA